MHNTKSQKSSTEVYKYFLFSFLFVYKLWNFFDVDTYRVSSKIFTIFKGLLLYELDSHEQSSGT